MEQTRLLEHHWKIKSIIMGTEEDVQAKGIGNNRQNNSRKLPKPWEINPHPSTGDFWIQDKTRKDVIKTLSI
jgi:hypothetical protein